MNRLRNELAIADTAKIAYINALSKELDKSNTKPTKLKTQKKENNIFDYYILFNLLLVTIQNKTSPLTIIF